MGTLTKEVADDSNADGLRMLAAVIFKNFVANRGGVSLSYRIKIIYRMLATIIIGLA